MAGTTLGFLKFVLSFDTIAFKKGMTEAERDLARLSKKVEKFGKSMTDIGAKMSIALTAPIVAFGAVAVREAHETEVAMAKVNNALAQSGAVAGQTAPKLKAAAEAFETSSLFEADEVLKDVTATLLRFGKIAPENFQAAQQAAVDLAEATGAPLEKASVAVGKALTAPAKATKALTALGINLTKGQIKQLEAMNATGKSAQVQAFMLDQLNSKIKGAALAAQNADPFNQLTDAFKQVAEQVGVFLIPVLQQLGGIAKTFGDAFLALPGPLQEVVVALLAITAAAGPAMFLLGKFMEISAKSKEVRTLVKDLYALAVAENVAAAGAALLDLGLAPILLGLAALAIAVTAVVVAWDNWDKIVTFVKGVYDDVKKWIVDGLNELWDSLKSALQDAVDSFAWLLNAVPYLKGLYDAAKAWIVNALGGVWDWLKKALDTVVGWFWAMVQKIKSFLGPVAEIIGGAFKNAFAAIKGSFAGGEVAESAKSLTGAFSGVDLGLDEAVGKTGKKAKGATKKVKDELKDLMEGIFPEEKAIAEYKAKLKALDDAHAANKISTDRHAEAVKRLTDAFNDLPDEPPDWWNKADARNTAAFEGTGVFAPLDVGADSAFEDIKVYADEGMDQVAEATKDKTKEMAEAFGEMGKAAVGHMKEMVDAFQGGDILGGIQHLLDVVLDVVKLLGQVGVFGPATGPTTSQTSVGARSGFGGFRAMGGPVVPGKSYVVGENGPEWFSSKKRGYINPGKEAQPTRVIVVPSPYFDTVVDHRAAAVAAPMAGQAAVIGVTGSEARMARRSRRNLLAA